MKNIGDEARRKQIMSCFGTTDDNFQKSITSNDMLEKGGKHGQIGEIRNGYKKIAEGKWQKVSKTHGWTKKEHQNEVKNKLYYGDKSGAFAHEKSASELDSKVYDDEHVNSIGGIRNDHHDGDVEWSSHKHF
jgi:hypothetical protein